VADQTRQPQVPPAHTDEVEHRRLLAHAINRILQAPTFIAPTLLNSWANYGGGYSNAGFYKDPFGRVHLRGAVAGGTATGVIFTLPEGYRPSGSLLIPAVAQEGATLYATFVTITANGNVTAGGIGTANDFFSLNGISFAAV
jgi:hypothetical protein